MSLNLLSTSPGGVSRFSSKFINDGASTSTDSQFLSCECDRMIYTVTNRTSTNPRQYHLNAFNIQTGRMTNLGYFTNSDLGWNGNSTYWFGGFLCDGTYFYFTWHNATNRYIYRCRMTDIHTFQASPQSPRTITCFCRMQWYDDHTIAVMDYRGLAYLDTDTWTWSSFSYKPSDFSARNFYISDKIIANTYDSSDRFHYYDRETQTYNRISLPQSSYTTEICGDGKGHIFLMNTSYFFVFDEETKEFTATVPIPFGNGNDSYNWVRACVYTEGLVYVIVQDQRKLWVVEVENHNKFAYTFMPWSINNGNRDDSRVWNLIGYHQYVFIQGYSFGYLNYQGMYKYNIGYKYLQYSLPCAEELINYDSKDRCLVCKPSYLTYEQVPDEVQLEPELGSTIKRASINKKNYKEIYSIFIK